MGLIDGLRRMAGKVQQWMTPNWGTPPSRDNYEWLETYTKSPRLSPVTKIATDLSGLPGKLYRIKPNGDREEIVRHPFLDFLRRPNPLPENTPTAIWKLHEIYLLIKGEGYMLIERDAIGRPSELWPIPPYWVLDTPHLNYPYYKVRGDNGITHDISPDDIFVQRELNPLQPYRRGFGQAEQLADEIETDEYMAKYAKKLFFNDATPPWIFAAPDATKEQEERFMASWNARHQGVGNAHRMGFAGADIKAIKLADAQKELDFLESRKHIRDAAIQHFGIPAEILGIVENSNRATAQQAKTIYAENVQQPRIIERQFAINNQLLPYFGDDLEYVFDEVIPQDQEFLLQKTNDGLAHGALLVNEWRRENDYEELPDGDVLYQPMAVFVVRPDNLMDSGQPREVVEEEIISQSARKSRNTDRDKTRQAMRFHRAIVARERTTRPKIRSYFDAQTERVVKTIMAGQKAVSENWWDKLIEMAAGANTQRERDNLLSEAELILQELYDWAGDDLKLERLLRPTWEDAAREGAEIAADMYRLDGVDNPDLLRKLESDGLAHIKEINKTSKRDIARQLADGARQGLSMRELGEQIRLVVPTITAGRAERIAQTEIHSSMMAGNFAQLDKAGMTTKTWVTVGDADVRSAHAALNNTTIPMDARFDNGLLYPGDMSTNQPAETVHCRCILLAGDPL